MIDFEHVYKTYETHNDENVALEDINIHIPARANPRF